MNLYNCDMTTLVSWFQLEYPEIVQSMRESSHHGESLNPYHIEGTIFEHTLLVCKQAEKLPYTLKLAALLHDIGKPLTRSVNPKNGNVSFYNHDAVGAFHALKILKREELGLSKKEQVFIFNLIALHTQIYKLDVEQLAAIGDKELVQGLIKLGKADHEGRFHTKGNAVIPHLISVESRMKKPRKIGTEKEVVVLVGLPASGKSTWVRNFMDKRYDDNNFEYDIISRDKLVDQYGKGNTYSEKWSSVNQKLIDKKLQESFDNSKLNQYTDTIIVDMTHMSKKSRRRSLSHFGADYKKKAVVFLTDLEEIKLRNSKRVGKIIPEEVYDKMLRSFYPPSLSEFDEIEYVI